MSFFKIKANLLVSAIVLLFFLLFSYIILDINEIIPAWKNFPDYIDYIGQSKFSLLSYEFYFPSKMNGISGRPFTVPLMYKLVGSVEYKIVILQKVLYCLSALIFVYAVLQFIKNLILKVFISVALFFYFTWWNILGWSDLLLSESFSMSFMILWFASIAIFMKKKSWFTVIIMLVSGFLFSFTRDSWPYIILFTYSIMACYYFITEKQLRFKLSIIWVFGLTTFLFQQQTARVGLRHTLPVFNAIAERVAEKDEYLNWFTQNGMPQAEQLKDDFRGYFLDSRNDGLIRIYKRYADGTYNPLFDWIQKNGKNVYSKFVLTHPSYFFLLDQTEEEKERIFCHSLKIYIQPGLGFFANAGSVFPLFNGWLVCILATILVAVFIKVRNKQELLYPFLLLVLCGANALLSYNADSLEVERHLFVTQIIMQLIGILCCFIILDLLIEKIKNRRYTYTQN